MAILQVLKVVAAVATLATGVYSFVRPRAVFDFIGLYASGARGIVEIRSIFGGLLIGLGAAPLVLGKPEAYRVVGIGYLAIAVTRLIATFLDGSYEASNLGSLAVEVVFGLILVL